MSVGEKAIRDFTSAIYDLVDLGNVLIEHLSEAHKCECPESNEHMREVMSIIHDVKKRLDSIGVSSPKES